MTSLDLSPLEDALDQLEKGILEAAKEPKSELLRDGVIQRFENSHELALKFIRRALETGFGESVDAMMYNEVLRTAAEHGLIENIEAWFDYRTARNKTSHTYDAAVAEQVFLFAQPFLSDAQYLLDRLHALKDRSSA